MPGNVSILPTKTLIQVLSTFRAFEVAKSKRQEILNLTVNGDGVVVNRSARCYP